MPTNSADTQTKVTETGHDLSPGMNFERTAPTIFCIFLEAFLAVICGQSGTSCFNTTITKCGRKMAISVRSDLADAG